MPRPPQKAHPLITEVPKGFKNIFNERYENMSLIFQCISKYLRQDNKENARHSFYLKESMLLVIPNDHYEIINFSNDDSSYCFEWKHSFLLTGLEKHIANYYNVNSNFNISFLYPYKRKDKNMVGKIDNDPWGVRIITGVNSGSHSTLWMNVTIEDSNDSKTDPFIIVESKDQSKCIKALVDEKNGIIAKSIDGIITFRNSK